MTATAEPALVETSELVTAAADNITPTEKTEAAEKKPRKIRAPKHDFKDGRGRVFAHKHIFGNGWVEDTAVVDDSVFVGRKASVYQFARVSGRCRVEGNSRVCGYARLSNSVRLKNNAYVFGQAELAGEITAADEAQIGGSATVSGHSMLSGFTQLIGSARIVGSTISGGPGSIIISGDAIVIGSNIHDTARIGGSALVHKSTLTGNVTVDDFAQILRSYVNAPTMPVNGVTPTGIEIHGHAVLANETTVRAPIVITDHIMLIAAKIFVSDWHTTTKPRLSSNGVIMEQTFHDVSEIAGLIAALAAPPTANDGQARIVGAVNVRPRPAQVSLPDIGRRIIRAPG
jgi:NDP-sugar pyrophosphorylase family protein